MDTSDALKAREGGGQDLPFTLLRQNPEFRDEGENLQKEHKEGERRWVTHGKNQPNTNPVKRKERARKKKGYTDGSRGGKRSLGSKPSRSKFLLSPAGKERDRLKKKKKLNLKKGQGQRGRSSILSTDDKIQREAGQGVAVWEGTTKSGEGTVWVLQKRP